MTHHTAHDEGKAHHGLDVPSHEEMMLATTLVGRPAPAFRGQAYFSGDGQRYDQGGRQLADSPA